MVFLGLKLQENRKKTGRKPKENQKKTKRKPKENQKKTEENRRKPEEKKTTAPPLNFAYARFLLRLSLPPWPTEPHGPKRLASLNPPYHLPERSSAAIRGKFVKG